MTMQTCWDQNMLGRCLRSAAGCILLAVLALCPLQGAGIGPMVSAYQSSPTAQNRAKLLTAKRTSPPALGPLAAGLVDLDAGRFADAASAFEKAKGKAAPLEDYVLFGLASAYTAAQEINPALDNLRRLLAMNPPSPLSGQAAVLEARIHISAGRSADAIKVIDRHGKLLRDPEREAILGAAHRIAGNLAQSAKHYQAIYFQYPASAQASEAVRALTELRLELGERYPAAPASAYLRRAEVWFNARNYARAREEYLELTESLTGADRETARVQLAASSYHMGRTKAAYDYLRSLKFESDSAAAERIYYLFASARRLNGGSQMIEYVNQLEKEHPQSPWRLKALRDFGNTFLIDNDYASYTKHFRACHEAFKGNSDAAYCHWWVTWSTYLRQRPKAQPMLEEHLRLYPESDKTPAALYFLGRLAENNGDAATARAYYQKIGDSFSNYYYASLARDRMAEPAIRNARNSTDKESFLTNANLAVRTPPSNIEPEGETAKRIERGRILLTAGLTPWAEQEFDFALNRVPDRHLVSIEMAQIALAGGDYQRSLRMMKKLNPGYQSFPMDAAPRQFWEMLYPFHYRESIQKEAQNNRLDPCLIAGLIRQESEFNAAAVSPANARGLIQIMPATGRELSRKVGIRKYSTGLLLQPEHNLKMGTHYLRSLIDSFDGRLEMALASYNAGRSRAVRWNTWADYREPAEFVENIPFSETRLYVQIVIGNAAMYHALYEEKGSAIMASNDPRHRTESGRSLGFD